MVAETLIFDLANDSLVNDPSGLAVPGLLAITGPISTRRRRLDTFDWRLLEQGLALESLSLGRRHRLRLRRVDDGSAVLEFEAATQPRGLEDLGRGALRRRLASIIDCRALLSRSEQRVRVWNGRVADRRDKTVARLEVVQLGRRGVLEASVYPVRGYPEAAEKLSATLRERFGAHPRARPAIAFRGHFDVPPGRYPDWRLRGLDPLQRADDAAKRLLAHYLAIMELNLPGMRDDVDDEFLHEFRIGLRRSRTLLRRLPGLFPPARTRTLATDLGWIGRQTGAVRDHDVHADVFPDYVATLAPRHRAALVDVLARVERDRESAHREFSKLLASAQFGRRWERWKRFVETPSARASRQPHATAPISAVAARALASTARKALRQGRRIDAKSPPEAYHDLRKTCKNLRYLIDAYREFYAVDAIDAVLKTLKQLQEVLGEHQDLDVHGHALAALREQMSRDGELEVSAAEALDALVAQLERRAARARQRFDRRFQRFRRAHLPKLLAGVAAR